MSIATVTYGQPSEMLFIRNLGTHGIHPRDPQRRVKLLRGYLTGLRKRERWFASADVDALREFTENELHMALERCEPCAA